jgi:hypothetical protein
MTLCRKMCKRLRHDRTESRGRNHVGERKQQAQPKIEMPSLERIQQELGSAKNIDDFFGKEGNFAQLFATTLEQMLEAELTAELGYEKYGPKGATAAITGMGSTRGRGAVRLGR